MTIHEAVARVVDAAIIAIAAFALGVAFASGAWLFSGGCIQ